MKTSEQINELAAALAKAQAEMKNAAFNKTNPHFKSKYADLASIRDAVVPMLAKHGISVVQTTTVVEGQIVVETTLMHASGQWLSSDMPVMVPREATAQVVGSGLTYARRYALAGVCCIASEDDDDGATATGAGATTPVAKPKNLPPAPQSVGKPWASWLNQMMTLVRDVKSQAALDKLMNNNEQKLSDLREADDGDYSRLMELVDEMSNRFNPMSAG